MEPLDDCIGFDWDAGNSGKNWERHQVTPEEAEEVFFCEPLIVRSDTRHNGGAEKRYYALGNAASGRRLFVAFTIRRNLIRVTPIRDMKRKESEIYANYEKANS